MMIITVLWGAGERDYIYIYYGPKLNRDVLRENGSNKKKRKEGKGERKK